MPTCLRLFTHEMRRAASRAACTAGSSSAMSTAMIAMTTSNSMSVKAASAARAGTGWVLSGVRSLRRCGPERRREVAGADERAAARPVARGPGCLSPKHRWANDPKGRLLARESIGTGRLPASVAWLAVACCPGPPRLQRRSRAGISPASCPARGWTPDRSSRSNAKERAPSGREGRPRSRRLRYSRRDRGVQLFPRRPAKPALVSGRRPVTMRASLGGAIDPRMHHDRCEGAESHAELDDP